jgi:hypothetical protein
MSTPAAMAGGGGLPAGSGGLPARVERFLR